MNFQVATDAFRSSGDFVQGVVWVYDPHAAEITLLGGSTFSRELAQAQNRLAYGRAAGFTDAEIWQYMINPIGNSGGNGLTMMRGPVETIEAPDAHTAGVQALAAMKPLVAS